MRPAVKRTAWIAGGLCLFIVTLIATVWVAGNTDPGRRLIERLTSQLTGGTVQLAGLGGAIPMQLTLDQLQLRDRQGVWLSADHVSLRWHPIEYLRNRVHVDTLQAARLHMERTPVSDGKRGGNATIPDIEVGDFKIGVVELGAPLVGTPAAFTATGRLQMHSLEDANADLVAHRTDGDGDYVLHASLDPSSMTGSLSVHEPAGGPLENLLSLPGLGALSANASVAGPRSAERVDVTVDAGNLHLHAQGSMDLIRSTADLDYSLQAAALAPRPDLEWSRLALQGNWHGSL